MPRLRNVRTGVIVTVSDERAETMGAGFEPVEAASKKLTAAEKKAAAEKAKADAAAEKAKAEKQ